MSFNVSEKKEWVFQYKKIWHEVELQLLEKLASGLIKGEHKYVYGKLKTWEDRIKTNFHDQDAPCDMYCNATAVLKTDYVEECKYTDAQKQQCNMLSNNDDDNDDGFLEV